MKINFDRFAYTHASENIKSGFVQFRHSHPYYDLLLFKNGQAHMIVENHHYDLQPNDIIIINPFDYHSMRFDCMCEYEKILLNIEPYKLPVPVKNALSRINEYSNTENNPAVQDIFVRLDRYSRQFSEEEREILMTGLLYELILNLAETFSGNEQAEPTNELISSIVNYINTNLTSNLCLDSIATGLHISKSYMNKVFSHEMGISIMKYVRKKKMVLAHEMIAEGKKATTVSELLGFDEYTTFYRLYKEEYKVAPSHSGG